MGEQMEKIGFIGLGTMGKWMALNMMKAGYELMVTDTSPEALQFLADQGAAVATTPAEMAAQVDWIFLSVPDTGVVESVVLGESGILDGAKEGLVVVDLSTIDYLTTLEIEKKLKQKGMVDMSNHMGKKAEMAIKDGLDNVGLYHDQRPLVRKGDKIIINDTNTLFYYHNRMNGYGLEKHI